MYWIEIIKKDGNKIRQDNVSIEEIQSIMETIHHDKEMMDHTIISFTFGPIAQ